MLIIGESLSVADQKLKGKRVAEGKRVAGDKRVAEGTHVAEGKRGAEDSLGSEQDEGSLTGQQGRVSTSPLNFSSACVLIKCL